MSHVIRVGDWQAHYSNESWRELCSLAWDCGWRLRLPTDWLDMKESHDALHWQMEYGLDSLTPEETSQFSMSLRRALELEVPVGKSSERYPYLQRAIVAEIAERIQNGVLIIFT